LLALAGEADKKLFDSLRHRTPTFVGQNEANVGVSCCFHRSECGLTVVCLPRVDG
jgi:hypothetical protein